MRLTAARASPVSGSEKATRSVALSLDRPRSYPALHSFVTQRPLFALFSTPSVRLPFHSRYYLSVFFRGSHTSQKWVPFRKVTPTSPSRPSPSSS